MATTDALTLNELLSKSLGDWIAVPTSANIAANTCVRAEGLNQYDGGRNDYFTDWWLYISDKGNAGVDRRIRNYYTSNATCNVFGAALSADAAVNANIRVSRYSFSQKQIAINTAVKDIYPILHRRLDLLELRSGDILPNSHFRDWAVSTVPDKWATSGVTAVANTSGGFFWGGSKSVRITPAAANGYMYCSHVEYPRLLDLSGQSVSFRAVAQSNAANAPMLRIFTANVSGATQTLDSSTTALAGTATLITLTDQALNGDLVNVSFMLVGKSAASPTFFDNVRVTGMQNQEYLLPTEFRHGGLSRVYIQSSGDCNTIFPRTWDEIIGWQVMDDGTDKYLRLPSVYSNDLYLRLTGIAPLETVSASSDTISLGAPDTDLLIALAKYKMYQMVGEPASSKDDYRYTTKEGRAYMEYHQLLPKLRMGIPRRVMQIPPLRE